MMNIALIGDYHLGIKNGNHIFHEYLTSKMDRTLSEISKAGIKHVFYLGDFFDNRRAMPVNIIDWCMNVFPKLLEKYGITAHILTGNHDTYYLTTNQFNSLDIFVGFDCIKVYKEFTDLTEFGISIVPWLNRENIENTITQLENGNKSNYVFGHFELNGFKMYANSIKFDGGLDLNILKDYRHIYTGHFHHPSTNDNVSYMGSYAALTRSDLYDLDTKGWYNLDLKTNDIQFMPDPYSLFTSVTYSNDLDISELDINEKHVDLVILADDSVDDNALHKLKLSLKECKLLSLKIVDHRLLETEMTEETDDKLNNSQLSSTREFLQCRIEDSLLKQEVAGYLMSLHDRCLSDFEIDE